MKDSVLPVPGELIRSLPKTSSGPSRLLRDACNNVAGPVAGEITIRQPQAAKFASSMDG